MAGAALEVAGDELFRRHHWGAFLLTPAAGLQPSARFGGIKWISSMGCCTFGGSRTARRACTRLGEFRPREAEHAQACQLPGPLRAQSQKARSGGLIEVTSPFAQNCTLSGAGQERLLNVCETWV